MCRTSVETHSKKHILKLRRTATMYECRFVAICMCMVILKYTSGCTCHVDVRKIPVCNRWFKNLRESLHLVVVVQVVVVSVIVLTIASCCEWSYRREPRIDGTRLPGKVQPRRFANEHVYVYILRCMLLMYLDVDVYVVRWCLVARHT